MMRLALHNICTSLVLFAVANGALNQTVRFIEAVAQ
jgi:hypothetical protein